MQIVFRTAGSEAFIGLLSILLFGCYQPERSLSLDPHNNPVVHILDAHFDISSGKVEVKWEYIGDEPVTAFELARRLSGSFDLIYRADGNADAPSYVSVGTYRDADLLAGESVFYQITALLESGGKETTQVASVAIPGAQALGVVRDPVALSALFRWKPDPSASLGYRVVRTDGNDSISVIYETQDAAASSFLDEHIADNGQHFYQVHTLTQGGISLPSRSISSQFYREATTQPVEAVQPERERMRLSVGAAAISGGTLALVARQDKLSLYQFGYQVGVSFDGSPRVLRSLVGIAFPDLVGLAALSVDLAGPPISPSFSLFPRVYIAGLRGDGLVEIVGYDMPIFNRSWTVPDKWSAPSGTSLVALARDNQNRIFAVAGSQLRAYDGAGGIVGSQGLRSGATDISVQGDQIGVILDNGQIDIGQLVFVQGILQSISWRTVSAKALGQAAAISHNRSGQVLALDLTNRKLAVLGPNGELALSVSLPPGDYRLGDIVVDQVAGNLVHVTDGRGDITTFIP
jgi:hypothetical protein